MPCDGAGVDLPPHVKPTPARPLDATEDNAWFPFADRLSFDFAHFNFVELQASEAQIGRGLDLWLAATLESDSQYQVPWRNAQEMYATIDSIQQGAAPWTTVKFRYNGVLPPNPPSWMLETYELCTRDVRVLLHEQLANPQFDGKCNYVPYQQFDGTGNRAWSNLMSGDWAWQQAVSFATVFEASCYAYTLSGQDLGRSSDARFHVHPGDWWQ